MKIAIDISQIVHPGGVGIYTRNLINALLKVDKVNKYLLFGTSLRKINLLKSQFIGDYEEKIFALPPTLTEFLFNSLRWPNIEFLTGQIDVFHSSDWMEPKTYCPKVTTVHDLAPFKYPELHDKKIIKVFKRKLQLVKTDGNLVIAVSKSTRKDLIEQIGIDPEKIFVIHEALDENFVKAKPKMDILRRLNLRSFIISDALKNKRKNLNNLLKAFEKLKDKTVQLILPGNPLWGKKEISELMSQSSIRENIILPGFLYADDLKALYMKAHAAVFPSYYEGFGLAVLEAMSCGCPVITSNVSSLPEVAGKAAILINPYDVEDISQALNKLLKNRLFSESLKTKGFAQVKNFSWDKAAYKTLTVYEKAIGLHNLGSLKICGIKK